MADADPRPHPDAPHLHWTGAHPTGTRVLLAAFEGWNDAGDAASLALAHLDEHWGARSFAELDPEEYYDFSSTRPQVRFNEDGAREITWPTNRFSSLTPSDRDGEVATLHGIEPQLRWRGFCDHILTVARSIDAELIVTLGALLAEVPHSRPVPVFGTAYDEAVAEELDLLPSRYEGPTGIVGVLHTACRDQGIRSASLWAATPSYLPNAPSPKAALALVEKVTTLLSLSVPLTALEIASANYERTVDDAVGDDEETATYIAGLEERFDADGAAFDNEPTLADEIEQFLRDQSG